MNTVIFIAAADETQFNLFRHQLLNYRPAVTLGDLQSNSGAFGLKPPQYGRYQAGTGTSAGADLEDHILHPQKTPYRRTRFITLRQDPAGPTEKKLAGFGHQRPAPAAVEEPDTKLLFKTLDM